MSAARTALLAFALLPMAALDTLHRGRLDRAQLRGWLLP